MLTWCDGLADVDLERLLAFHRGHGRLATLTAVEPPARFGRVHPRSDRAAAFGEKVPDGGERINSAFFVLKPEVLDLTEGDRTRFEHETLTGLAFYGELMAYRHDSFWRCMHRPREPQRLNAFWQPGSAPWRARR